MNAQSLFRISCLLLGLLAVSQTAFSQTDNQKTLAFHVTVNTEKGKVITGLRPEDFAVEIDKVSQPIVQFNEGGITASVAIVIDDSGSTAVGGSKTTAKWLNQLLTGLSRFVELSDPSNEYFAVSFSSGVKGLADWTTNSQSLLGKLPFESRGPTAFYDTCYGAIQKLGTSRYPKKVLFVLTDGQDNASKHTFKGLRELLRASDVVMYAVGLISDLDAGSSLGAEGESVLLELSELSGGRMLVLRPNAKPAEINEVFESFAHELRTQYRLAVNVPVSSEKQKARKVKVKVTQKDEAGRLKKLEVRTRQTLVQ